MTAEPLNLPRPVVLVGLMGAGKSCVGRRLAAKLGLPFVDADSEIEAAAGCTVSEIFARYGEPAFRDGERRVVRRLLSGGTCVLATGGGAFMDAETRRLIGEQGISVWLKAELEVLLKRTAGRDHRPLLKAGDPREILQRLIGQRYPVYASADITVQSVDQAPEVTVDAVWHALVTYLAGAGVVPSN